MERETEVDVKPRVERVGDDVALVTADVSTDGTLVVDVKGSADVEDVESISVVVARRVNVVLPMVDGTLTVGDDVGEVEYRGVLVVVVTIIGGVEGGV